MKLLLLFIAGVCCAQPSIQIVRRGGPTPGVQAWCTNAPTNGVWYFEVSYGQLGHWGHAGNETIFSNGVRMTETGLQQPIYFRMRKL